MNKVFLILFLLLCGVGFGAYSNANVSIISGGAGITTNYTAIDAGLNIATGNSKTIIDANSLMCLPSGTHSITRIRFVLSDHTRCSALKVSVFNYNPADGSLTYLANSVRTVTVAANLTDVDLSATPITGVSNGDVIAITATASNTLAIRGHATGSGKGRILGFAGDKSVTNIDTDDADGGSDLDQFLQLEVTTTGNHYIAAEIDTSSDTYGATAKVYQIPAYVITGGQYIILEDVTIADTESLTLAFQRPTTTTLATEMQVIFDFSAETPLCKMTNSAGTVVTNGATNNCQVELPDPATPDTYDVYVYYDQQASGSHPWGAYFINKTNGSSFRGGASADPVDKQLTPVYLGEQFKDRVSDYAGAGHPTHDATVKWTALAVTNAGGSTTIGKVIVARKPVLVIGDSISTTDYVGYYIGSAFTEPRYAIHTGIGGTYVVAGNSALVSILDRWRNGAVYMRDVVVCLVNGPGINDLNLINTSTTMGNPTVAQVAGGIGRVVGDATKADSGGYYFGGANDVVMCNLIPFPSGETQEKAALVQLNRLIQSIAYEAGVPLADVSAYAGDYTGAHPEKTEAGSGWVADTIAAAYENNSVPANPEPAAGDVRSGTAYGYKLTGTLSISAEADWPDPNDVRDGTDYDNATKTGRLTVPASTGGRRRTR